MTYGLTPPPLPPSSLLINQFAYIVSYRFTGPTNAYNDFYETLRSYDDWFNYTPNLWIIKTRIPMVNVAALLRSKIRTTDWLMVMPAKGPVDGWLPQAAWDWLNKNLNNEW